MKMPDVRPVVFGATDEHSYISLTDFDKLQSRIDDLFPKRWVDYAAVTTYVFAHRETGISIVVDNDETDAQFKFSIFRLPAKLHVAKYHLVRYQFLSHGGLKRNCWVSLADNCPHYLSFDYTVALDAIQAYLYSKLDSKE